MSKKEEITAWLQGPRRYLEGVRLYELYGDKPGLGERFRRMGVTRASAEMLAEELRRTAAISEEAVKAMRRTSSRTTTKANAAKAAADKAEQQERMEQPEPSATAVTPKVVKFRERYPFLSEDGCPDVLKVVVADMFTAYGRYKEAHARLAAMPGDADAEEAARLSEEVVENFLNDRELQAELEHYRDTGELLGKAEKVRAIVERQELEALPDIDLMKKVASAKANLSKARTAQNANNEARWTRRLATLEAELERRKKN